VVCESAARKSFVESMSYPRPRPATYDAGACMVRNASLFLDAMVGSHKMKKLNVTVACHEQ
jgi:hypothetical protein